MDERDYGKDLKDHIEQEIRDRTSEAMKRPKVMLLGDSHWGFAWGLIIVLVGVGLLLHHLGIIPFDPLVRYWPLLLVVFGIMNLLTRSGRFFGFLLILAGAFLQLNQLGITRLSFADLWPVALIAVGLLLMWGSLETRGFLRAKAQRIRDFGAAVQGETGDDPKNMLNAVAVFGGCERRVSVQNFQGGRATAVFGGIEMDLSDADIDDEAILEINCVFGGVEIRVPESWHVHSRSLPVFGGYEDKTRMPHNPGKTKTLIVTGMIVFGGVEIKN